jgi:predicted phosphoribosyltransferase
MFRNREEAARELASRLKEKRLYDPVVLAIPRGGVLVGAVLARELGAELDVVLSRKLRGPGQQELMLGAVSEDGRVYVAPDAVLFAGVHAGHMERERATQLAEIERLRNRYRGDRPSVKLEGRTVIVADDIAVTGSSLIAALDVLRAQHPGELIAAVPVIPANLAEEVGKHCHEVVCLLTPEEVRSASAFYADFPTVPEEAATRLLRGMLPVPAGATPPEGDTDVKDWFGYNVEEFMEGR